jgi:hypothetical protein
MSTVFPEHDRHALVSLHVILWVIRGRRCDKFPCCSKVEWPVIFSARHGINTSRSTIVSPMHTSFLTSRQNRRGREFGDTLTQKELIEKYVPDPLVSDDLIILCSPPCMTLS